MTKLKILAVQPGASYSTSDVYEGHVQALRERGHTIIDYRLDSRIEAEGAFMKFHYKRRKRAGEPVPPYTTADVIYKASIGAVERALRHQPDWVLVFSGMYFSPDVIIMLHRAGIRQAVVFTESPYDDNEQARLMPFIDLAFTNERSSVAPLRQASGRDNVFYLPHAYDPQRHYAGTRPGDDDVPAWDVVFIGTCFQERKELLEGVDWTGINLGLYGTYDLLGSRHPLRQSVRGGVVNNPDTAALYRRAKIGLNLYRTSQGWGAKAPRITHAESMGPRAYELAAAGCFTLSDYRAEVGEVFGDLVPTFSSPAELERLVRYYLTHADERQRMAAALPESVSRCTFADRVSVLEAGLVQAGRVAVPA